MPLVCFPDENKISFMRDRNDTRSISIYDFETKREWQPDFQLACGEGYGAGLALSPDGQELAFMVGCDDEWSLQIAPSSGGNTREVARLQKEKVAWGRGVTWTPDGRHLLYLCKPKDESDCELWRVPVEGGEPQKLDLTIKLHGGFSIHPDGHRIAFTGPGPGSGGEIWVMENILPTSTANR
jgi:Tol biopolymer transport system component